MTALADRKPGEIFVELGSEYNPGWHITRCKAERQFEVLASHFDDEAEALAELPRYQEHFAGE